MTIPYAATGIRSVLRRLCILRSLDKGQAMNTYRTIGVALALTMASFAGAAPPAGSAVGLRPAKLVTLDYASADVADVIRALAAQSGVNIALSPGAKGLVTIHLRGKTVDEAIVVVTNMVGLSAKRLNGTYVVAPRAEMRETVERLGVSRVVPVTVAKPETVAALVTGAYPDVTARPQQTAIVLIGAPDDLDGAVQLAHDQDVPSPKDELETRKIELHHRAPDQAAEALNKIMPKLVAEPAGSSLVVSGTRAEVELAAKSIEMLDVETHTGVETRVYRVRYSEPTQLIAFLAKAHPNVKAYIGPEPYAPPSASFNAVMGKEFGASVSSGNGGGSSGGGGGSGLSVEGSKKVSATKPEDAVKATCLVIRGAKEEVDDAMRVLAEVDVAPRQMMIEARVVETSPSYSKNLGIEWGTDDGLTGTTIVESGGSTRPMGFGNFGRTPFSITTKLNAMITRSEARMLANPKVAVINNEDASIFIGDTIRYPVTQTGVNGTTIEVVVVPVGILLLVNPHYNDDGNITMNVHPVVSTLKEVTNGLPQTSSREAETTVRVKDGDTLVIGGLIKDEDRKTMSRVPILGDLPLVGQLFRNESRTHNRNEIVVFLTIHLLPQ